MDSTPSNGSGIRARSKKATTSPRQAPSVPNGRTQATPTNGASSRGRAKAARQPMIAGPVPPFDTYPAIAIEDVQPELDGGRWPIKRVVGDMVEVSADIFKEGHDLLQARVLYQCVGESQWHEAPLHLIENDRW